MEKHIPGVPSLLKELGIHKVGNFILPCVFQEHAGGFFQEDVHFYKDLDLDRYDTIVTEPYRKIDMGIFSAVDPICVRLFFINLMKQLHSKGGKKLTSSKPKNFLAYECRIQDIPRIKEHLFKPLIKLKEGHYIFKFSKSGRLKKIKKINQPHPSYLEHYSYPHYSAGINVFLDKRTDINEEMVKRNSTVINHHTFHTYDDWNRFNKKEINEVLEVAKKLGNTQLINLHHIRNYRDGCAGVFPLPELRKRMEEVGFNSIYHAEVERRMMVLYRFNIRKLTDPSEIEDVKTGNYRWLILKSD